MFDLSRRNLMASSAAAALGASVAGRAVAQEDEDTDTPKAPMVKGDLERFAWTALGAEVTGPEVTKSGTLFFSVQHPSRKNPAPYNKGGIGYVEGYDWEDGSEFDTLGIPETKEQQGQVTVGSGDFVVFAQEGDNIGGDEDLGYPQTPDGLALSEFPGSRYGNFGYNPDCNRFIPTNEAETEGYLFTNFEQSPGDVSRIPLSRAEDGSWEADLENARNLSNTEELRSLGGTRINCYGDTSPWNTYLSAEEEYSHPRTAPYATVSDFTGDSDTEYEGPNKRGAAQFYNRPNPDGIQSAVDEYYGEDSWFVQGYWALAGLELQAYYLGADAVDTPSDLAGDVDLETSLQPIEGPYPNPYRYGYIVDFREPDSETPEPVKYHVMGRAAWECPDVQADEKTVYLSCDGDNKGFYKFVADEPIPSYEDPMDVEGSLYVAKVTNQQAAADLPPYEAELELDWWELGHARNGDVAAFISQFDDVDQVCYLETHADTDWQEDLQTALEEADKEVVENGNRNYIPDEDIVEWARQWEENGPKGVDADLQYLPFVETRACAKEVGATVEFRKSEGIDSVDDAGPGEYVYLGMSEINTGLSDDEGDVQVDRVDGGLVYRAEIEEDYNLSTLEPVIVGPDATDTADVANSALINVDNVFVLEDGRVLCCEDADQYNRTYPNDCLYVYTPPEYEGGEDEGDDGNGSPGDGNSNPGNGNPGNGKGKGNGNAGGGNGSGDDGDGSGDDGDDEEDDE
ncbi:alkaline phosphatase PhoX [Halobium salinum]|uniref:Alkaline phosphatase PhoX n=1 Tax=Halobium salinum TaxID=1364940 RepID=A0ABD5PCG6_9EURY|nr:alkaline phosphatase PhoX [Halobium salinum]